MGMGTFNRRPRYQQQNSMGNAGAMLGLLKEQGAQLQNVAGAVDQYGQSRKRNEISELMGTEEYKNADPATAQAMISALSGGRDLGENFAKTLKMSDDNKGDIQGNEWKENAATTLFGRQNSQIAQRHSNAVSRQIQGHKNSLTLQKLRGGSGSGGVPTAGGNRNEKLKQIGLNVQQLQKAWNNAEPGPARDSIELEMKNQRLDAETLVSKKNTFSTPAGGAIVNSYFDTPLGGKTGKPAKVTNASIPSDLKIGLNSAGTDGLQRGINSGQLVVQQYETKPNSEGKTFRRYRVTDSMGNQVSKNQYSRF